MGCLKGVISGRRRALRAGSLLLILLIAFAARLHLLGDSSIWFDEGWSVWMARQDLASIALRTASDTHPPLYYWFLHGWKALVGEEEFALRYLSLCFGVLTVSLVYRIGREWMGWRWALLASLLLAAARFHVWWSQEIRMYALATLLCTLSTLLFLRLWRSPRDWKSWLVYAVVTSAALHTLYLSAFAPLVHGLFAVTALILQLRGSKATPFVLGWLLSWAAIALSFLPWSILAMGRMQTWSASPAFDLWLFLQVVLSSLALGKTTDLHSYLPLALGFLPVIAAGLWPLTRRRPAGKWELSLLLGLSLLVPPLITYCLSLAQGFLYSPPLSGRYLLLLAPLFYVLLAWGLCQLKACRAWLPVLGIALIGLSFWLSLADYYGARFLKDNYQTLTSLIRAQMQPGDAIVLNSDADWPTFVYHAPPSAPWYGVPSGAELDAPGAAALLTPLAGDHPGLWLVTVANAYDSDPGGHARRWLEEHLHPAWSHGFDGAELALFPSDPHRKEFSLTPSSLSPQYPVNTRMGALELVGYDRALRRIRTGDRLRTVLYWRAPGAVPQKMTVMLTLAGEGTPQPLEPPANRDEHSFVTLCEIKVPAALPAGTHALAVTLIDAEGRAVGPVVPLGEIEVHRREDAASVEQPSLVSGATLGDEIVLTGYDLPEESFLGGESVPLTLYWKAAEEIGSSYTVFVHVLGDVYNSRRENFIWGQVDRIPLGGTYPTSAWSPGTQMKDAYLVPLDSDAPGGEYLLEVGMYDAATGERLPIGGPDGVSIGDSLILAPIRIEAAP
jgi:4-amino-4-deoxy-L-arabinose transferase-like glycosyltransferase